MGTFRYAILGAAKIGAKFCQAVSLAHDCEVCAVASKSLERAEEFARKNGVSHYYGSYEEMLREEKPDCAYIAVTPHDHYRLAVMCVEMGIPVLCEKAMFQDSAEAESLYAAAKEKNVFVMEAMWSRFLPPVKQVKSWVEEGRIGIPQIARMAIGFRAPEGAENRYFNPRLGGGAAKDITVYAYEITTFILEQYRTKRTNLYITDLAAPHFAEHFEIRRLCDRERHNAVGNRFMSEMIDQLLQEGRLVSAETTHGAGIRTATARELNDHSKPVEQVAGQITMI